MRILIDVCHPSDVHLFKYFYKIMKANGHDMKFTARHKEVSFQLLDKLEIPYTPYGRSFGSKFGKVIGLIRSDIRLYKIVRQFKPDLVLSHGSFYLSHVAFLLRIPHITFEDTGNLEQIILYKPFSKIILTPHTFVRQLGKKQLRFKGTKELAYLHPNHYKPDPSILNELGIQNNEKYVLLRFVSWNASHDFGHKGITLKNKLKLIEEISKYAKVFISSEANLPEQLKKLRIKIPPEKILDVMYYAELLYGESATMASEAAVMGVPAIYLDNIGRCYTRDLGNFGLIFNYTESEADQAESIKKAVELVSQPYYKENLQLNRNKMLRESIDLSSFLVWFIEEYPVSASILHDNPDYQDRFITK
jgi:predicted glycosyltransferase